MIFTSYLQQSLHIVRNVLGTALMISALCLAGPVWAALPATQYYGSVEYLTGGFGLEESTAIKNVMADYPLVLTFSARYGNRSAYVAQVQVVVRDQHDATVLNVESQGPFLLARLMPGTYQLHVTYKNETQSRPVTVAASKSARMVFEWVEDDSETTAQNAPSEADNRSESARDAEFEFAPGSIPGLD